jgi:hypothetical protein
MAEILPLIVPGPSTLASRAPKVLDVMSDCAIESIVKADKKNANAAVNFFIVRAFY